MAMTLVEASKHSNDVLQKGVIELLVKNDPILSRIQWKDIRGNGLTYDVETTLSGAAFYNVGDTWDESTSVVTQHTANTAILGGDADVDEFLATTRSNMQDLMGEQIQAKTKAIRRTFNDAFLYGYKTGGGTDAKKFDGLHFLLYSSTYNSVALSSSSGTPKLLNLSKLEQTVDMVKNGKPDVILMTKMMRRYINVFLNGVGGLTKADVQGKTVQTLFDIPIVVSDHLSDSESCIGLYGSTYGHNWTDGTALADNDSSTSIFVLQFAPYATCGIQSGGPIRVKRFRDELETKNAKRVRLVWYPGVMQQSIIACSKVTGVDPDGVVAA